MHRSCIIDVVSSSNSYAAHNTIFHAIIASHKFFNVWLKSRTVLWIIHSFILCGVGCQERAFIFSAVFYLLRKGGINYG